MISNTQINRKLAKKKDNKAISFTDERLDAYEPGKSKNEKKVEEWMDRGYSRPILISNYRFWGHVIWAPKVLRS